MLRLTRLKIVRFRHVVPNTELHFGEGFNVLLGKNAAGKTTLLTLIAAITSDDLSVLAQEEDGFHLEYDLDADAGSAFVQLERKLRKFSEDGSSFLGGDPLKSDFEERATVRVVSNGVTTSALYADGRWKVGDEEESNDGLRSTSQYWLSTMPQSVGSGFRSALLRTSFFGAAPRLDESTGLMNLVSRCEIRVPLKVNAEGVGLLQTNVPVPELFIAEIASLIGSAKGAEFGELLPTLTSSPPLDQAAQLLGFSEITTSLRLKGQELKNSNVIATYGDIAFRFRRSKNEEISFEKLSFGQKRLFGFLWYCATRANFAPIVADELANGMHHEWIRKCVDLLSDTQSFLATQHPLLLDYMPEDAQFIHCTIKDEALSWRNFSAGESTMLAAARDRGIMQVSEILQSEALW